ncbi:MlaE family ABC transporter permease, partial [Photobacterium phosphoreum]|uniref:MlaE family ABC transporter permease n=1 Tax=Photobacterium phosphoreum TaxID=659 RepID=UPI001E3C36C8
MSTPQHIPFLSVANLSNTRKLQLQGDWLLANYQAITQEIQAFRLVHDSPTTDLELDLQGITHLDTAGAERIVTLLGDKGVEAALQQGAGLSAERRALLQSVVNAMTDIAIHDSTTKQSSVIALLVRMGESTEGLWHETRQLLGFAGLTLETLVRNVLRPSQWRVTSIVAQIEETALNAVPIIALLTFLVGAVVAFLGATILADFGASIYTVNLVGFSFLREFAVLLTAILMAGRTASAFTAQLGSMKVNEEIDAIRVQGLDPIVLLVLPRVLAMLLAVPILTLVGMV